MAPLSESDRVTGCFGRLGCKIRGQQHLMKLSISSASVGNLRTDGQNRHRRTPKDFFCHRSHQPLGQSSPSMRSKHNQLASELLKFWFHRGPYVRATRDNRVVPQIYEPSLDPLHFLSRPLFLEVERDRRRGRRQVDERVRDHDVNYPESCFICFCNVYRPLERAIGTRRKIRQVQNVSDDG